MTAQNFGKDSALDQKVRTIWTRQTEEKKREMENRTGKTGSRPQEEHGRALDSGIGETSEDIR